MGASQVPTFMTSDVPLGAVLTCSLTGEKYEWGPQTSFVLNESFSLTSSHSISRHVARLNPTFDLYPANILHRTEVDHWLCLASGPIGCQGDIAPVLKQLNDALATSTYLVAKKLSIADLEVFAALYKCSEWHKEILAESAPNHVVRWYTTVKLEVENIMKLLPEDVTSSLKDNSKPTSVSNKREDGGKFVELPGAKMGEVVVRFPPEASGYLHIGHAKAALLNQYYQKKFNGKLIMRFDDTNPAKEKADFEKVILEDLKLLDVEPDIFTHTSDHFDKMSSLCEQLINNKLAYADDTDAETMRKEREERKESCNRNNSVEKNLKMWLEMKNGSAVGQHCCVRAKIDMNSDNGCLRDPTIYRCKNEVHVRTGNKYKVYPTYDFACPIIDSIEGVTHALRTTEYHDRDDQFFWFIEKLQLRPVHIYEYSRLNMNNTVLSKRKLTWFVDEGLVDGWDDARFPTVRGIIRRGMTIEGLKEFIIAQGSSRSVVNMEWDKIWAFNKKVIDKEASRYTALEGELIPVHVTGVVEEVKSAQKHPKDPSKGMKNIWLSDKIFIEAIDAEDLKEGINATFINWGNLKIVKIIKSGNKIVSIEAETDLSNTDYKKTLKLTWLAEVLTAPWTPILCVYFGHLIYKSVISKEEDFKNFVNQQSRSDIRMMGDDDLKSLKVGDIIQIQRKGFFRVDQTYEPFSAATCQEKPLVLFAIPDGHSKETPALISTKNAGGLCNKEKLRSSEGKVAEKSPQEELKSPLGIESGETLHIKIQAQGDKVRILKSEKAGKDTIKAEVDILLSLKQDFKKLTNLDWKPDVKVSVSSPTIGLPSEGNSAANLHEQIKSQGDKVKDLKSAKADKGILKPEIDKLLALKQDFKNITNMDWKPDINVSGSSPSIEVPSEGNSAANLHEQIKSQGDKVRDLKSAKADKGVLKPEIDKLLALKRDFKNITNMDWKPDINVSGSSPSIEVPSEGNSAANLHEQIKSQGDKVRDLKFAKADKGVLKPEIDKLLALKQDFKNITSMDWKPDVNISASSATIEAPLEGNSGAKNLHEQIKSQGDKVRDLKSAKADKGVLKPEIDKLLSLKKDFKNTTNMDWKPDLTLASIPLKTEVASVENSASINLHEQIKTQGDKVRDLKTAKADKGVLKPEIDKLLALKQDFKNITNMDWKPDVNISASSPTVEAPSEGNSTAKTIHEQIKAQGEKVRNLKMAKADKCNIKSEVDILLMLKKDFKNVSNIDWTPDFGAKNIGQSIVKSPANIGPKPDSAKAKPRDKQEESSSKKQTRLGIEFKKEENFADWYTQVITKAEMIEYYNVSGCYILRPWSYSIWEIIKDFFDKEIKKLGVENAYFPIFISKDALEKEKSHIEGFSPEVAWVTKYGNSDMAEPIAIRPTSETVIYPAYAKWIQSYRDLPMRLNQWSNVVRWEFKQATPFIRTREFLWQEGHTAFALESEAVEEVHQIIDLYARIYEEYIAVPVIKGRKTEKEKFAGGVFTTTTEAFISANGRAIQGATSHYLGQNFAKMFDITFENPETLEKNYVYQNSWGITTRSIGVLTMVHGDNKGVVLPPMVAPKQVVIVPVGITAKTTAAEKEALLKSCQQLEAELNTKEIRVQCDFRDNITPAWKFNHWELKGVPLRLELGPRELSAKQVFAVRRDTGDKQGLAREKIVSHIINLLDNIQQCLFLRAKADLDSHIIVVHDWSSFIENLENKNMMLSPFCGEEDCEILIKKDSTKDVPSDVTAPSMGAKALCIPFEQPHSVEGQQCVYPSCKSKPKFYTLFGRSY